MTEPADNAMQGEAAAARRQALSEKTPEPTVDADDLARALEDDVEGGLRGSRLVLEVSQSASARRGRVSCAEHDAAARTIAFGNTAALVVHDRRGAPYALTRDGEPDASLFVSCTDEDAWRVDALLLHGDGAPWLGMGIDLCSVDEFTDTPSNRRFWSRTFTEAELAVASGVHSALALSRAWLFAAREAAFKATAAALRERERAGAAVPTYSFANFEVVSTHEAVPIGRAKAALDELGLGSLTLASTVLNGRALVLALAQGAA